MNHMIDCYKSYSPYDDFDDEEDNDEYYDEVLADDVRYTSNIDDF